MGRVGRRKWWNQRNMTICVCFVNLFALFFVLHALHTSLYVFSPASSASSSFVSLQETNFSMEQIEMMKEFIEVRRKAEPSELARLANSFSGKRKDVGVSQQMKEKMADEILQMLNALEPHAYVDKQQEALERWRGAKLESLKKATNGSTTSTLEERALQRALAFDWLLFLEEIGLSMPIKVSNKENMEISSQIDNSMTAPGKCNAESHTEYDGITLKSGSTNLMRTAGDCCQACIDQAETAGKGEATCNVWLYCPFEEGCHSSDAYKHKHRECFLKKAERPHVRFKGTYPDADRDAHPDSPLIVHWVSGFVG